MHVYTQGEGDKTIVLMPGLGGDAPSLDFKQLIEEFKNDFKVVVVEPFGYGFSDKTDKERSVENIVDETRQALKEANIGGQYILMPHSISGVYAQYYAATYPDEVKAIIMLDTTLVKDAIKESNNFDVYAGKKMYTLASVGNLLGVDRLLYNSIYKDLGSYTEDEKKDLVKMWVQNPFNKTQENEINTVMKNCETVNETKMQKDLPILKFIAISPVVDKNSEEYKDRIDKNSNEFK